MQVCGIKSSTLEKERLILSFTGMWKFQSTKDNGNKLTLGIIVPLHQGHDIPYGVGYCLLFGTGTSTASVK